MVLLKPQTYRRNTMALIFDYDAFGTTFPNAYLRITQANLRYEKYEQQGQPAGSPDSNVQNRIEIQYAIWVGASQETGNAEPIKREHFSKDYDGAVSSTLLETAYGILKGDVDGIPDDATDTLADGDASNDE